MKLLVNIIMLIGAAIALLMLVSLIYAINTDVLSNGGGMAILALQLFAAIGAVVSIIFAAISLRISRHSQPHQALIGKFGIGVGILVLLSLMLLLFF